jgi:iron complex outermembrane receptor protein
MSLAVPTLCLLCGQAQAADAVVSTLPAVTVRGTPITDNASTMDKAALAPKVAATSDTASLLADVPGLSLNGAGGVSSLPSIHGLADDRLRIKVDGMDLIASCPNHMNPALSYIDPSNVGTLKVYAGITPVSAGGDSIGGTIIAESRAPEFAAAGQPALIKGEAGAFYRSNNKARGLNLSASYATEQFNISYSGASSQADDYTTAGDFKTTTATGRPGHTLALDEVGSSAYETRNHSVGLAFKSDKHLFELKLGKQDMPNQLYPNQRMDLLNNAQDSVNLRYTGQFDWGSLQARAYQENVDHTMDFGADKRFWYGSNSGAGVPCTPIRFAGDPAGTCASGMPMYTQGETTGATVKADMALTEHDLLRMGAEVHQYHLNDWWPASGGGMGPATFWNIKDGERDRTAIYGEWESRKGASWTTLLGARAEQVSMNAGNAAGYGTMSNQTRDANAFNSQDRQKTDNNLDLTALTKYTANANYDIEFGLSHKVRSPNVYERYTWSTWAMAAVMNNFVGDGNGYVGDVNLKPEKANTLSATFDWHAADSTKGLVVTPFYTQVTDYIDAVQWNATTNVPAATLAKNQFSVLKFVNQSARLYGLDISGHMPLATSTLGVFGLKGLLNYTNGSNQDTGDELYNVMPLNAKLALTHQLGGWDNSLELVMVKDKSNGSDMRNEIKTPGYSLVNARVSYSVKQVRVDFGVENLVNKYYFQPTGGAYIGQGTSMSMNGVPYGIAVPGMGRSIYVGVNVKF